MTPAARALGVLVVAAALVGCGPLPLAPPSAPPLTERAWVAWVEPAPDLETRDQLLDYLDLAERAYRARFKTGPLPVVGVVWHPGWRVTRDLLGYVRAGVIHLPAGGSLPGAPAVHEFHHLGAGADAPGHEGKAWRAADWLGRALAIEFWR